MREIRVTPVALGKSGVRIDYAAREAGAANVVHFAACGFAGTTFERERLEIEVIETETGLLGEARLLYLKRFWLPAAESESPRVPQASLPQIPASAAYALQQFVNALALAAIYALLATAYSLIYGLVGRINLAFGEIAILGAYGAIGAVAAAVALGLHDPLGGLVVAFAVAAALSAGWSAVVGRFVVAPLHARHRLGQPILIATAAVALTAQEFLRVAQGPRERWMPPVFNEPIALAHAEGFVVTVTPMQIDGRGDRARGGAAACCGCWRARASAAPWRAFADDPAHRGAVRCRRAPPDGHDLRARGPSAPASPDGSSRSTTATSRSRWARCSASKRWSRP